jgi:hypothetical protein
MKKYMVYLDCDMYMFEFKAKSKKEAEKMYIENGNTEEIKQLIKEGNELISYEVEA